jgi:hypothetical protein
MNALFLFLPQIFIAMQELLDCGKYSEYVQGKVQHGPGICEISKWPYSVNRN